MAGDAPIYVSGEAAPAMPRVGLEPTGIPQLSNNTGSLVAGAGEAVEGFSNAMFQAKQTTNHILANAEYLNGVDALREKYANPNAPYDPDAAQKFQGEAKSLQGEVLEKYPLIGKAQALTQLYMDRYTISANRHVETDAHAKGFTVTDDGVTSQSLQNQNAALTATTPADRQDAIDRQHQLIVNAHEAGWYSDSQATAKLQQFQSGLDHGEVLRDIAADPRGAVVRLADTSNFPSLTPAQRETYQEHAREAADKQGTEAARGTVVGAPYAASLIAGQFVDGQHVDQLFDKQIIAQESGGKNLPPNAKGAFGPAQITPGFARDYFSKLSPDVQAQLGDIKGLSDQELTAKLAGLPAVSTEIGKLGFQALAQKYNSPVLAMAAYNAGPANADRWQAAAQKQFGPNPTPAQIASVIDFPETQKYVSDVYGRTGARMDAYGVSPAGRWALGSALGSELTRDQSRQQTILREIASVQASSDPIPKLIGDGVDVSSDRIAAFRTAQQQAAAGGDVEASKRLQDLDFALQVKPQVDRLYRTPFPIVNAMVDHAQADVQTKLSDAAVGPEGPQLPPTISSNDVKTLDVLKKTRDAIDKARNEDPTSLVVRAGISRYVPLDTAADPNDPNFREALTARAGQATIAKSLYQGKAIAVTPDEAQSLHDRYQQAGANDQFALLKTMAETLPADVYKDTVSKIVGDAPGAQLVGDFARTRPDLAREMLTGAQILKKEKDTGDKTASVAQVLADKLGGQVYPSVDQQQALVQGALAVDAARRAQSGSLYAGDASGLGKAIDDIAGTAIRRAGVKVPLPPTMNPGVASDMIDNFGERELRLSGGAYDSNGRPIAAQDIAQARWRPLEVGGSRYVIDMPSAGGFRPVMNYEGGSLVVNLATLGGAPLRDVGGLTPAQREFNARRGFPSE